MTGHLLVISESDHPRLPAALAAALRRGGEVILLTDDRDLLPALPRGVRAIEPEELLPDGAEAIEPAWDEGVARWLGRLFPGTIAGLPAGDLLWASAFLLPELETRLHAVALAREVFATLAPAALVVVGEAQPLYRVVVWEARRRGLPVARSAGDRLRDLTERALLPARVIARSTLRVAARTARAGLDLARRRVVSARLEAWRGAAPAPTPRLWIALDPSWRQTRRHLLETIAPACARARLPLGVAFAGSYGARTGASGEPAELELIAGPRAALSPAAVDQVVAVEGLGELARVIGAWLALALPSPLRALRHAGALRVGGLAASAPEDALALVPLFGHPLFATVEAAAATGRFVARHPGARVVVFGYACTAQSKVADLLLQRHGVATVDYIHGYTSRGNIHTVYRSASQHHAAWTRREAELFRRMGANRHAEGGYMPRLDRPGRSVGAPPVILAITTYLDPTEAERGKLLHLKHGRRLARALIALTSHLGERAEVVLRPHPHEDRALWRGLFAGGPAPRLSEEPSLAEDLARATVVLATHSSATIEALVHGVPVLLHRGPVEAKGSLFRLAPDERRFATGEELIARVEALLAGPVDLGPERRLLDACFGPSGRPAAIGALLAALDPGLAALDPGLAALDPGLAALDPGLAALDPPDGGESLLALRHAASTP